MIDVDGDHFLLLLVEDLQLLELVVCYHQVVLVVDVDDDFFDNDDVDFDYLLPYGFDIVMEVDE